MPDKIKNPFRRLSRNIVVLSFVSFLNDISSECIARILPVFLRETFGVSFVAIGWIEGMADSLSIVLRLGSGWVVDRFRKTKPLILFGYALSALVRPLFPVLIATFGWMGALWLKFLDRVGKAVRVVPRDAMIAAESVVGKSGEGFGLNRAMDTLGALIGVAVAAVLIQRREAVGVMVLTPGLFRLIVLTASIFGFVAVALIAIGVRERVATQSKQDAVLQGSIREIPRAFFYYLVCVSLFSLAGSSDAFLILKLRQVGFSLASTLWLIVGYNALSALTAYPVSRYSDKLGHRRAPILIGWLIYALAYLLFGLSTSPFYLGVGFIAYGLYSGFVESTEKALVADLVPLKIRGRTYGIFNFVTGLMLLPANLIFGFLADRFGFTAAFLTGAGFAALAAMLLAVMKLPQRHLVKD